MQRRYQKLIEESPSPIVDAPLRVRLAAAAVAAGRAVDYVGVGTVEFVVDRDAQFYFLEMNTRLQVEHPVTELVTGLDLVRLQLQVAEGRPLPPEVDVAQLRGHAIEARLYAEDVAAGFLPATGVLYGFSVPELPGVRVDTGVAVGSRVSSHYDSLLAKVIAHASSREEACRLLARALSDTYVHGVATNRELLVALLRSRDYQHRRRRRRLSGPPRSGRADAICSISGGGSDARAGGGPGRASRTPRAGARAGSRAVGMAKCPQRTAVDGLHGWRCGLPGRIPIYSRRPEDRHGEPGVLRRPRGDPRGE